MLKVCQSYVQPFATYAFHLTPKSREPHESWDKLEKTIINIALGIYCERMIARQSEMLVLNTLNEVMTLNMTAMKRQLRDRLETPSLRLRANPDYVMLAATKGILKCKEY